MEEAQIPGALAAEEQQDQSLASQAGHEIPPGRQRKGVVLKCLLTSQATLESRARPAVSKLRLVLHTVGVYTTAIFLFLC